MARKHGQDGQTGEVPLVEVGEQGRLAPVRPRVLRLVDHQNHGMRQVALFGQRANLLLRFFGQARARCDQLDQGADDDRRVPPAGRRGNRLVDHIHESVRVAQIQQADVDGDRGAGFPGRPRRGPANGNRSRSERLETAPEAVPQARNAVPAPRPADRDHIRAPPASSPAEKTQQRKSLKQGITVRVTLL